MSAAEFPKSRRRRVLPADAAMAAVILLLGLFLAGTGRQPCPAVAVLLGTSPVPRVRGPARHRGEHGRPDRDRLVGHVPCHCCRGSAPGTVREGPRRLGCRKVRPRLHAPPRPGRRRSPTAHRTARHGIHRAVAPGTAPSATRRGIRRMDPGVAPAPQPGPRRQSVTSAPVTPPPAGAPAVAHPQWRPLSPVVEPGPLAGRPLRLQQPAGQGIGGDSAPRRFAVEPVGGPAGALRLRRRHSPGLAPALPGEQGHHRRQPRPPAAGPDTQDSARPLTLRSPESADAPQAPGTKFHRKPPATTRTTAIPQRASPNSKGSTMSAMTSPRAAAEAHVIHCLRPCAWSRAAQHRPAGRTLRPARRRRCCGCR